MVTLSETAGRASVGRAPSRRRAGDGFTLIELSVVLVLIGLISGGILLGRELIHAAEIRSQVSQLEQFAVAVGAFRVKYGGLPGDLAADEADALGFEPRAGDEGHGDGNGRLNGTCCNWQTWTGYNFTGETSLFWNDLGRSGMIAGAYTTNTDDPFPIPPGGSFEEHMPLAKLGTGVHVNVWAEEGAETRWQAHRVVFALVRVTEIRPDGRYRTAAGLTPRELHAIDAKLDDGLPYTGFVGGNRGMPEQINVINVLSGYEPCARQEADGTMIYDLSADNAGLPRCILNVGYSG